MDIFIVKLATNKKRQTYAKDTNRVPFELGKAPHKQESIGGKVGSIHLMLAKAI